MGQQYSHLSSDERILIEKLHCERHLSVRKIAEEIGRDKSTVSRELRRGLWFASNENGSYRPYRPKRLKTGPWTVFCQVGVCVLCSVFPQCRQRVFRRVCGIGRCLSALCCCCIVGLFGHEGVFAPVGAAFESDEPSVVDGAVDEGGGHVLVAEHASPSAEFDVGGVDDAPCLVAVGNDLEEEPAALLVYGQVAELVDDEKSGLADAREFPVEPVLLLGAAQTHEQSGRGEEAHRDAPLAGEPSDRDGQVALAGADGPVEHEVLASGDEVEVLELRAPPVGGHLQVGPVIAVEGLVGGEAGLFEQAQAFGSLARVEFGREPSFDEVELVGRGLGERAGEHAACQGQAAAHLQDAFAFLGRGRAPASGLRDHRIGSDAHRSSPPSSVPVMNRS